MLLAQHQVDTLIPRFRLRWSSPKGYHGKILDFTRFFQLLGSLFAVLILVPFVGNLTNLGANQILVDFGGQTGALIFLLGILVEVIGTFLFIFVILRVTKEPNLKTIAGMIIGLTLATLIYFTGPLTNAGLNPVRSIFPALFQGGTALEQLWIFILGPMIGAFLAAVAAPYFDQVADFGSVTSYV